MGPSRSCWNGTTSELQPEEITSKGTRAAITILYKNPKVKVRSPDGHTEYFDIIAGVLQGDTLAP